jgi:hypothetical protein
MEKTTKSEFNFEIDRCYTNSEIIEMKMKPLNNHKLDYLIYEKNSQVYYFEKVDNHLLRFFCSTGRQSFYLS